MKNPIKYGLNTSIVMNSYNRKNLLLRTCLLLEKLKFGGQLVICDASENEKKRIIQNSIRKLDVSYELIYLNVPKKNEWYYTSMNRCFKKGIKKTNRKYTILTFEDDIPIPTVLTKFEDYLNKNKSFNACMGRQIWHNYSKFNYKNKFKKNLKFSFITQFISGKKIGENYSGNDVIAKTPEGRIRKLMNKPAHYLFAFQRSSGINNIIAPNFETFDSEYGHFSTEYYYWFVTALRGNIKYFHTHYILKTYHDKNLSQKPSIIHSKLIDKLVQENQWSRNIKLFRKNLYLILKKFSINSTQKKKLLLCDDYIKFYLQHRLIGMSNGSHKNTKIFKNRIKFVISNLSFFIKVGLKIIDVNRYLEQKYNTK